MPKNTRTIPDPLNGDPMVIAADTKSAETEPFIRSLKAVPKTGLHNPLKNVERYVHASVACIYQTIAFFYCLLAYEPSRSQHADLIMSCLEHSNKADARRDMCVHGCRYNMLGLVTHKVAAEMRRPEVNDFFARLIQRTSPKSYTQVGNLTALPAA
jgi:hypothetical protein